MAVTERSSRGDIIDQSAIVDGEAVLEQTQLAELFRHARLAKTQLTRSFMTEILVLAHN